LIQSWAVKLPAWKNVVANIHERKYKNKQTNKQKKQPPWILVVAVG